MSVICLAVRRIPGLSAVEFIGLLSLFFRISVSSVDFSFLGGLWGGEKGFGHLNMFRKRDIIRSFVCVVFLFAFLRKKIKLFLGC